MQAVLRRFYWSLVNVVFPLRCMVCGEDISPYETMPLCREHAKRIRHIEPPFCDVCGRRMVSAGSMENLCADCHEGKRHFDRAFSATAYTDVIQVLIGYYKYHMKQYLAPPFAGLMRDFMDKHIDYRNLDIILPVPLHWRRYMYRGFNQAFEMIKHFAPEFGLKTSRGNLRRIRNTLPQVMLKPEERKANIVGAFRVVNPEEFRGKRLLLVDDVFTTGATIEECARVLKKAGAHSVTGYTLAQSLS